MLAIPWISNLFGKYVHVYMSWRWLWAIPFPVMASVAVAGVYRWATGYAGRPRGVLVVVAISSAFVLASPTWVVSGKNYTEFGWPSFKLPSDSIHFEHFGAEAAVVNGRLYLQGESKGF